MTNPIYYNKVVTSTIQGNGYGVIEPNGTLVVANGGELRLHDGSTAGGNVVGGGSTGNFTFNGNGVGNSTGDIIISPGWDGQFTGNTYITLPTNSNAGGEALQVVNNNTGGVQIITRNNATWTFNASGVLSLPNALNLPGTIAWNGGSSIFEDSSIVINSNSADVVLVAGAVSVSLLPNGTLQVPGIIQGAGSDPNVYIETVNGGTTNTWNFDTNGKLTFPDGSTQKSGYGSAYTGWFQPAGTVVTLDNITAQVTSGGIMQVGTVTSENVDTGTAWAWNGIRNKGATLSSFGQGGTNWVLPGNWLDISETPLDNDFEVATVNVFGLGDGHLYRITYVGSTNSKWSVAIERII